MTSLLQLKFSNLRSIDGQPAAWASLGPQLDRLRDELCEIDEKMLAGEIPTPASKQPLGTGFVRLPERLLADYEAARPASELGRMLAATKQMMSEVDRVVVLGGAEHLSGGRALMQTCCQPYFNQLSRGERGSRPRLVFVGASLDNDEVQGVLHLLGAHRGRAADTLQERWGLVVIGSGSASGALRYLLPHLRQALQVNAGGDPQVALSRTLLVTDPRDPLIDLSGELNETNRFPLPAGVVSRFSVLSMPGLLVAALLGINIMKLLEGARHISRHFSSTKAAGNVVLQLAGWNHLMESSFAGLPRGWAFWSEALAGTGCWYRQLLNGSLRKQLVLTDPLAIELSIARGCGSQASPVRPWLTQVITERFRFDPLPVGGLAPELHQPVIQVPADRPVLFPPGAVEQTMVDALQTVYLRTQHSLEMARWPTAELLLPQVDELSVGQLLQLLMLATVVEARLTHSNPFE